MILGVPVAAEAVVVLGLEVGGGGIEQQHVHLQVEQVRHREEHPLLDRRIRLQQGVHRPVEHLWVRAQRTDPWKSDVVCGPLQRGQLRGRRQRAVGHQREDHPLGGRRQPTAGDGPTDRRIDAQPPPQLVQQPRPAERPRAHKHQLAICRRPQRLLRVKKAGHRAHQSGQRGPVQLVLAAEVVDHPCPGHARRGVPLVVRQLQVADRGAVLGPPCGNPHVHSSRRYQCQLS